MPPIRVRFAPAPAGELHLSDARTALFNWLYARRRGGTFVLRIEDAGPERVAEETADGLLDDLRWLGLTWDEGPDIGGPCEPYRQSARIERHRAAARRLFLEGHAYYCYCAPDRLAAQRENAEARGGTWRYDRTCLGLSAEEAAAHEASGVPRVLRFKVPGGRTGFDDAVHGRVEFDGATIGDFVILGAGGDPTWHLSTVVDDAEMRITDVIRDEDPLSRTPEYVLLLQALGAPVPRFAHVPFMTGSDGTRLREGGPAEPSMAEYRRQGYLPEAIVNVLALSGWSPGDDREVLPLAEIAERFDLDGLRRHAAVFDAVKLDWMNAQWLARLPAAALARDIRPLLAAAGLAASPVLAPEDALERLVELLRPRIRRLTDAVEQARPLLEDVVAYAPEAVETLGTPDLEGHVGAVMGALGDTAPFDEPHVEAAVRAVASARGVPVAVLIEAIRVAVTGRTSGPDLAELLVLLGRERTNARLEQLRLHRSAGPRSKTP